MRQKPHIRAKFQIGNYNEQYWDMEVINGSLKYNDLMSEDWYLFGSANSVFPGMEIWQKNNIVLKQNKI